jgi:hypothetical protein
MEPPRWAWLSARSTSQIARPKKSDRPGAWHLADYAPKPNSVGRAAFAARIASWGRLLRAADNIWPRTVQAR